MTSSARTFRLSGLSRPTMDAPPPTDRSTPCTREEVEQREREQLAPAAVFSHASHARPVDEPDDPFRTCFVRDRDRVLHCGAFRRLKDKTQVFVIDEGDFYRTRLTHTLEVAQLARFLARALRLNESLAEVLALVHDIGHPPFGHEGERMLNTLAGVPFDHNAQALRIVDVLENPYADREGLNLTHVVRRMILKHGGDAGRGAAPTVGHVLEAQVTDLADSTAYQHHDIEDALRAGILDREALRDLAIWRESADELGERAAGRHGTKAVLNHMLKRSLHDVIASSTGRLAAARPADSDAVEREPRALVRFSDARGALHRELAAYLFEHYYRHPRVLRSADVARRAISAMVQHYGERPDELPEPYRRRIDARGPARSVCDYVAGMTDRFAIEEGRRLLSRRSVVPAPQPQGDMAERVAMLEDTIGYVFRDKSLAAMALTHASARSDACTPNERLEFLGDAVLGLVVGQQLYQAFPDQPEGELSRMKSVSVSRHALFSVAEGWGLAEMLMLGPGFRGPDDVPPSLVADAVEAVLGAVYLDGQLEPAAQIIQSEFTALIQAASEGRRTRNVKSELQAYTQGRLSVTPHYQVLGEAGPDHAKRFTVAAVVDGLHLGVATGRSKRQAEQRAARIALRRLQESAANGGGVPDALDRDGLPVAREAGPPEDGGADES
ncbi:MAG: ribonuclease III [Planctomycetes bacterium]|nr:ribonuclease III [Planctomycetota bacterium]